MPFGAATLTKFPAGSSITKIGTSIWVLSPTLRHVDMLRNLLFGRIEY